MVDQNTVIRSRNSLVHGRIDTLKQLLIKLSSDDNARGETLDELISQVYTEINNETDFRVVNRDVLMEGKSLAVRRMAALNVLQEYIKHLQKKIKPLIPDDEKKKDKKEEADKKESGNAQNQTTTQAVSPDTSVTAATTPNTQSSQPMNQPQTQGPDHEENEPRETQRFPQTGETMTLDPATGQTIEMSSAGKVTLIQNNNYIIVPNSPPPIAAAFLPTDVSLANASTDPSKNRLIQDREKVINERTKREIQRIKDGAYGERVKQTLEGNDDAFSNVAENIRRQEWGNFTSQFPEIALHHENTHKEIGEALARQKEIENTLRERELYNPQNPIEYDPQFRSFADLEYGNTLHDRIAQQQDPTTILDTREYIERAVEARKDLLRDFTSRNKIANPYGSVTEKIEQGIGNITQKLGIGEKAAQGIGSKAVGASAGKAATATAQKLAEKGIQSGAGVAATSALTAALSFLGPLAPLVAKALTWLGSKLIVPIYKFIKRKSEYFAGGGTLGLGFAALTGNLVLGGIGLLLLGLSLLGGGPEKTLEGLGKLGSLVLALIVGYIIRGFINLVIGIFVLILATAFILFIINSGAAITPQSDPLSTLRPSTSFYMLVQKSANPTTVSNANLPRTITYTVTITARQVDLTNITFENTYLIFQEPRVAVPPQATLPTPPTTITAGNSYTFTYTTAFNADFKDSVACDNFRVTAQAGGSTDSTEASACVTFGNPPTPIGCSSSSGPDITQQLASRITAAGAPTRVNLLPESIDPRSAIQRRCIRPTMIVLHWSAGPNDDPSGNNLTYNTLVSRNLACQMMTDTDDVWLTQPFYQTQVEMAWCVNDWNIYSINNEMAGISFDASPPAPNLTELEYTYKATCELMEQYNIPWTQIRGHYEINPIKDDPGAAFLQNVFIPEIRERCPND